MNFITSISRQFFFITLFAILIISTACSESQEFDTLSEASINPGDDIPNPAGPVVLTLSGDIESSNADGVVDFDLNTLEQLGLVSYAVEDPWLQQRVTYSGVLLSDLLEVVNASDTMTEVFAVALDGYSVPIPLKEFEDWPVLVATQSNGSYMSIENSGPTRIIFPYDRHDNLTEARNMSVWNLESIEVK
jgi:hypothetical protein